MIAIPRAAFMRPFAVSVGSDAQPRCDERGHEPAMIAIPRADVCGSLHVAAVEPDHDGTRRRCRGLARNLSGVRLHDFRADAQRPVVHRASVLRPAERQQLG